MPRWSVSTRDCLEGTLMSGFWRSLVYNFLAFRVTTRIWRVGMSFAWHSTASSPSIKSSHPTFVGVLEALQIHVEHQEDGILFQEIMVPFQLGSRVQSIRIALLTNPVPAQFPLLVDIRLSGQGIRLLPLALRRRLLDQILHGGDPEAASRIPFPFQKGHDIFG